MRNGNLQLRSLLKAHPCGEAGQALIETALTLPLLILLLIGSVELVRVVYAAIEVSNAAKAAVQFGAQNVTTAQQGASIQASATNDAANLTLGQTTIVNSCACASGGVTTAVACGTTCSTGYSLETLTVTTQTTFDPIIHLPGLPTTFNLYGHAVQEVLR